MKVRYYIPMAVLALLHPSASLSAQPSPVEPQTTFTVLLIDRPATEAESAGAEGSVKSLDPTVYYRAPVVRGGGDVVGMVEGVVEGGKSQSPPLASW